MNTRLNTTRLTKPAQEVRIATLQFSPRLGETQFNRSQMLKLMKKAVEQRAKIITAPEMCLSGYIFNSKDAVRELAETETGPTFQEFSEFCLKHGVYLAYGYPEIDGENLYNSQNLIDPAGKLLLKYRKKNLYLNDKIWALANQESYLYTDIPYGRVGLGICMDLNSSDYIPFLKKNRVQIILFAANWVKAGSSSMEYWKQRWKQFQGVVAFANRYGQESDTWFCGQSHISEGDKILAVSPASSDSVLVTSHLLNEINSNEVC